MQIGEPRREIIVEPLVVPAPTRREAPEPEPERPVRTPEPTKVPAKVGMLIFLAVLSVGSARAQEPRGVIRPADPISVTAHDKSTNVVTTENGAPAPTLYPVALPPLDLGEIARRLRAVRGFKATTLRIFNEETMAPPVEVKQEAK